MNRTRLPFTLTPIEKESFDSWLQAYAARLDASVADVADALGLPRAFTLRPSRAIVSGGLNGRRLHAVSYATGLDEHAISSMFQHKRPTLAAAAPACGSVQTTLASIERSFAPSKGTRFCPCCLKETGGRHLLAWRIPWTFACPRHGQVLVETCDRCGTEPGLRLRPHPRPVELTTCHATRVDQNGARIRCGAMLDEAKAVAHVNAADACAAQIVIDDLAGRAGEPGDPASDIVEALTDLGLLALNIARRPDAKGVGRVAPLGFRTMRADTLTAAVRILHGTTDRATTDLVALVDRRKPVQRDTAVPQRWRAASRTLTARIAHSRDAQLAAADRVRHTTTLASPRPAPTWSGADPAVARAARIPDQIWSAWAVRLLGDDSLDPAVFRPAMAVALLLPHSSLPISALTPLMGDHVNYRAVGHQLTRLADGPRGCVALNVLTELALAIDAHGTPIDYPRRRRIANRPELIDQATWRRMADQTDHDPGRQRRWAFAQRYLYELLTDANLAAAPPPYTLPDGLVRCEYHDFVLGMPARLVTSLTSHAHAILASAGVTEEPLQWQPPVDWVSSSARPGTDPDQTDPTPIHRGLRLGTPTSRIAKSLGMSMEHVRYVVRRNPIPAATPRKHRPGAIVASDLDETFSVDASGVFYINPAWLKDQYVTWNRTLISIAAQVGCTFASLKLFAKHQGLPVRPRGGGTASTTGDILPDHPSALPEPLRSALTGRNARQRIDRFLAIAEHHTISKVVQLTGATQSAVSTGLTVLENRCGGNLIQRGAPRLGDLTPLGQQLRDQALHHLIPTPSSCPSEAALPEPLRSALTCHSGQQRIDRFLAITEHRSIRKVAELTGTTGPTLSGVLARLERSCGGALIRHERRNFGELTPLGQQLHEQILYHSTPRRKEASSRESPTTTP